MKKFLVFLCTISLIFATAGVAGAAFIYFDDITTLDYTSIPSDYEGLTWDENFYVISNDFYNAAYGNSIDFTSGEYAAWNAYGAATLTVTANSDFDFLGAYFAGWAQNDEYWDPFTATSITVTGFNDSLPVGTAQMDLLPSQFLWLGTNMTVDTLVFESSGLWLMDDFDPVPEPSTMLLLGSGLIGLAVLGRKKLFK